LTIHEYLEFSGVVAVTVTRNGAVIKPEHLHTDYKMWITRNHEKFDVGAIIDEFSAVIVSKPHHKEEMNIKDVGEKPLAYRNYLIPLSPYIAMNHKYQLTDI